jgi:hypothetical protein
MPSENFSQTNLYVNIYDDERHEIADERQVHAKQKRYGSHQENKLITINTLRRYARKNSR